MKRALLALPLAWLTACSALQHDPSLRDWRASPPSDILRASLEPSEVTEEVSAAARRAAVASLTDFPFRTLAPDEVREFGGDPRRGSAYLLRAFRFTDRVYGISVYRHSTRLRTHAGAMGGGRMRVERTAVIYHDSRPVTRAFATYGLTL